MGPLLFKQTAMLSFVTIINNYICLPFDFTCSGMHGRNTGQYPWEHIEDYLVEKHARMVGAQPIEVATMNTLTVNIHLSLVGFQCVLFMCCQH